MAQAASLCLEKGYRDCGGYVQLPWITSLVELYRTAIQEGVPLSNIPLTGDDNVRSALLLLLSTLQGNLVAELLTGGETQSLFDELRQLLDVKDDVV